MCGIAGTITLPFSYADVAKAMAHRGPDEQNGYEYRNINLFHLRLSVLDLRCGGQPMHLAGKYSIVFNGEIYNHLELRKQFQLKATTSSDTETILLLYEKFGADFLNEIDGMFAFVILDKIKNELFIARDRAGKKPLYYYKEDKVFAFASELNGLRSIVKPEIEEKSIYHYLRLGSFYGKNTPFKSVFELTAGTYLQINCDSLTLKKVKWWNIHDFYLKSSKDSFGESLEKIETFLRTAIRRRLASSDLEIGSFLSGGIDSSLIVALATEYTTALKTFTVSFPGQFDEAPLAKLVASKYQTHHTEIRISFVDLKNDLETILGNYGEPFFDSSAIPSYYVSREAKKYVTVVLNGDGADELFGGYRRYVPFTKYDFFKAPSQLSTSVSALKKLLPVPTRKTSLYNYLYRLLSLSSKSGLEVYLTAGVDIFEDYTTAFLSKEDQYMVEIVADFEKIAGSDLTGLKKIMNLDFDINLFSDLLVKIDIASMANSQEARSPFLSKEILEYAPTLPDQFKVKGRTSKYLLRQLAVKYLPPEFIQQPKRGFEIPLSNWIDNELRDVVFDYLGSSGAYYQNFIKKDFVQNILNKKATIAREKRAKILWTLLSLEIWHKRL